MENKKGNENFVNVYELKEQFTTFDYETRINVLKKLVNTLTSNCDYQDYLSGCNFVLDVLQDLFSLYNLKIKNEKESEVIDTDSENGNASDDFSKFAVYSNLFFLCFHNLIIGNSKNQENVFDCLFVKEENFNMLTIITILNNNNIKTHMYLLSTIYNLIIKNSNNNLKLNKTHLNYLIQIIKNSLNLLADKSVENSNILNELNDWIHIIYKNILNNDVLTSCEEKTIFSYFLQIEDEQDPILHFELFRDCIDLAKDSKNISIKEINLKFLCEIFLTNFEEINEMILTLNSNNFYEYENYEMSCNNNSIKSYRKLICFIDIFSVLLVHDDFRNYRNIIQENIEIEETIKKINFLLQSTDTFYETTFKRNKSLNPEEAIGVPILKESNFLFGFQTNLMKFLSNFAYRNENMKNYFIADPISFYYFLNHLKLDKCNPFKKEWSVLFIKAVSEGNYKIQSLIEQLRPDLIDPLLQDYILKKEKIKYVSKEEIDNYKLNNK